MYNSGEVTSHRRTPEEWPELLRMAEAALPGGEFFPKEPSPELRTMTAQVADWNRTTLDQNRFYAYSQMLCGVARRLADPAKRERMIEAGARRLLSWSSTDHRGSGGISGLRYNSVAAPFESLIAEAYMEFSPEVQLIGDILTVVGIRREKERPSAEELDAQISEATRLHQFLPMTHLIENVMTGATTNLLDTVLMKVSPEYRDGALPSERAMKLLRHPRLPEIAQHACGLLLENTTSQASFIQIEGDHIAFVNPNHTDRSAEAETVVAGRKAEDDTEEFQLGSVLLESLSIEVDVEESSLETTGTDDYNNRNRSIICPAASITGMVPGVVNMVVAMVEIAVEELRAGKAEAVPASRADPINPQINPQFAI